MAVEIEAPKTVIKLHPCIGCGSSDITLKVFEYGRIYFDTVGGTCNSCHSRYNKSFLIDPSIPEETKCAEVWNEMNDLDQKIKIIQSGIDAHKLEIAKLRKIKSDRALGITVGTQSVI